MNSFGMLVPNRFESVEDYKYGFQGQEKDDEIKGEGNSLNYTFRMHDPRAGRFFAVDPLFKEYPHYTPYSFSGNKVIASIEFEGLEDVWVVDGDEVVKKVGPYVGAYTSEQAANNNTNTSRYTQFISRLPTVARPQAEIRSDNLQNQVNKYRGVNPGLSISRGVLDGVKEAPSVILPEIAIAKTIKAYKAFKQARIAVKAVKTFDKVDNVAYHGMEFLDDGFRMVEAPIEKLVPKITAVDDLIGFRKDHILNRHKYGAGKPGKTEFPSNWSDDKILNEVNKIANNRNAPGGVGKWDSPYKTGTVDGIEIRVDFYPSSHPTLSGKVSTAYPTNTTPNPTN